MVTSPLKRQFLHVIFLLCGALNTLGDPSPANATGDVLQWIDGKGGVRLKPYAQIPLQPQWIGKVTKTAVRDPDKLFVEEEPDSMRLNALWRDSDGRVVIARTGKNGHTGSDTAVYQKELPTLDELKKATKLSELRRWLGPQHDWTDLWGDPKKNDHWSEGWTYFTTTKNGHLRWLNVFALVVGPRDSKDAAGEIETLTVREGFFHTADPVSDAEKRDYPSAEALEAAEDAARESERAKIPEPLRSLVAAREKPGDSDLQAYTEVINAIRRDPQPQLFTQMAERIDDGTCEMQGMVEAILCENSVPRYGAPWELKKKQTALRHAAAAIYLVTTPSGLETWTELLLQALGGGHLQPKAPDGEPWIDVEVKIEGDSKTLTTDGSNFTEENLMQAKHAMHKEFVRMFPDLKPE